MAYQYIRQFSLLADGNSQQYICRYDPVTGDAEVIKTGPGGEVFIVTEQQLGVAEGTIVYTFCVGTTEHVLRASLYSPFLLADIQPNSVTCGFIPPPAPNPNPEPIPDEPTETPEQTVYQIRYQNFEKQLVYVWIFDMLGFTPNARPKITDLATAQGMYPEAPLLIRSVDNDEDKFKVIRAKEAVLQFFSSNRYDISTFASGDDKRWYVKIFIGDEFNVIFQGYLLSSELQQAYQPNPNVVQMIATDGLAGLKELPLVDPDNKNPKNKSKIITYLSWALRMTKLNLGIAAQHNISEETPTDYVPWLECSEDAKTFEDEINISEDAYTVIEKILGHDSFLQQHNGHWWIKRIDELEGESRVHFYDFAGNYIEFANMDLVQEIGPGKEIIHIQEDQLWSVERPRKEVRLNFRYEYPLEAVCNIDFRRGIEDEAKRLVYTKVDSDGNPVLDGGFTTEVEEKSFSVECWNFKRGLEGTSAFSSLADPVVDGYFKTISENGYEVDNYLFIERFRGTGGQNTQHAFISEKAILDFKDKISFSVQRRRSKNIGTAGFSRSPVAQIRLYGTNGKYYTLWGVTSEEDIAKWVESDATFATNNGYLVWESNGDDFDDEWKTISADAPPLPTDGDVEILLLQDGVLGASEADTYFRDLSLNITPYINGAYTRYPGQYNRYSHETKDTAKLDEDVYLGEAPRRAMKGHIFTTGNTPARRFFLGTNGLPPVNPMFYGRMQALAVWNQYNRFFTVLEGSQQGLRSPLYIGLDSTYLYRFTDTNKAVNNKLFMLLSFEQDYYTCQWRGTFIEVYDSTIGKRDLPEEWQFRYLSER